jgi:hypothetical protein
MPLVPLGLDDGLLVDGGFSPFDEGFLGDAGGSFLASFVGSAVGFGVGGIVVGDGVKGGGGTSGGAA